MSNSTYAYDRYCPEDNDLLDETEKAIDQFSTKAANGLMEQLKENLQTDALSQFAKDFDDIIAPYKISHNYKNLCIRLIVWQQNLWRWMLSKPKEKPVSDDLEEEIGNYVKNNFHGSETLGFFSNRTRGELDCVDVVNIARHFAEWQKQKIVDEACDWIDLHAIDYWGTEAVDNGMMLNDFRKAMNEK